MFRFLPGTWTGRCFLFKNLLIFKEIWSVCPVCCKGMAAVFGLEDMKDLLELILLMDRPLEGSGDPPAALSL